jgi:hypothetical protein
MDDNEILKKMREDTNRQEITRLIEEKSELKEENFKMREALIHFMNCDVCDKDFICIEGQMYADRAGIPFSTK